MRNLLIPLTVLALGCEPPAVDDAVVAEAPLLGKADGRDQPDRACKIVLRSLTRRANDQGGYANNGQWWVWYGLLDQALDQPGTPKVLYHPFAGAPWYQVDATPIAGAGAGYQRYEFRLSSNTSPVPGMSGTSISRSRMEVMPFVALPGGGRLFDHNRVPGDFDNYLLTVGNYFSIEDDAGICPAARPQAVLSFLRDFTTRQQGTLVAGGQLTVHYDAQRLTRCRATHNGYPFWSLDAFVRLLPSGQIKSGPLVGSSGAPGADRPAQPFVVDLPADTTAVELWFRNGVTSPPCEAWDSRFGQNYRFAVERRGPQAVGWAGDWGGSFARDCLRRDGLAEPVVIDSYVLERACTLVFADVWVPGLTDRGTTPERLFAEVEWSKDGGAIRRTALAFDSPVGNNYRFRWDVPRQEFTPQSEGGAGREIGFAFRFSTDGNRWYRIAKSAGPDGGDRRTIKRGF